MHIMHLSHTPNSLPYPIPIQGSDLNVVQPMYVEV